LAGNFSSQLLADIDLVFVKKLPATTPTRITSTAGNSIQPLDSDQDNDRSSKSTVVSLLQDCLQLYQSSCSGNDRLLPDGNDLSLVLRLNRGIVPRPVVITLEPLFLCRELPATGLFLHCNSLRPGDLSDRLMKK
jgi:hypothetical protein